MGNFLNRLMENKGFVGGILFTLLVSLVCNIFLAVQTIKIDEELSQAIREVEGVEDQSNYESIVASLERRNKQLEEQLQELKGTGEVNENKESEGENPDDIESSNQPEVIIDKNEADRGELTEFISGFVDVFLTRGNEFDQDRREKLTPYLNNELLDSLAPEGEDVGFDFEIEHGDIENTLGTDFDYSVKVLDYSIYIDEESLGEGLENVLVYVTTRTIINDSSPTEERSILDVRVSNEDKLEVNNIYYRFLEE